MLGTVQNKMNIAMVGHKRIPSREGGIEIVVEELATRMVKEGYNVVCYNRKGKHVAGVQYDRVKNYKGVMIKEVFTIDFKGLAAMTSSFFALIRASFGNYNVVHIHAEGPAFFSFLPKLFGKRVIVTIHGLDWNRAKWGNFASWYIKTGEKNAVKFADEIIVLSDGVKDYFWKKYKRETKFIPNGVDKPLIVTADKIKTNWGLDKESYILALSRLTKEKKIDLLIDAYKSINTDRKLVIAGGSSDTEEYVEYLHELASGDDRIIFTGFVQGREMEELYSNAYIYVLPSEIEGMPLSLLEAMSYGNCCLVSDIPENADVVGSNGVIFDTNSKASLVKELNNLLERSEEVCKYKVVASDYICKRYNWDDVVGKTLELYR